MELGILDQSPIRANGTAAEAVNETLALAQAGEAMGYSRYWVAEHHNTRSFAGSCPEILMTRIASVTRTMRVGCAGILMQHYAPLKIAEQFRMLETLFPGRIDLGLGRAPGTDPRTAAALQNGPKAFSPEVYPQKVDLLIRLLEDAAGMGSIGADHPYEGIHAVPPGSGVPQIWLLGSGPSSASIAAHLGTGFGYAHFISGDEGDGGLDGTRILESYRQGFTPARGPERPDAAVAVSVICAPTDEQAHHLAQTRALWVVQLLSGEHAAFLPPEEAAAFPLNDMQRRLAGQVQNRCIIGSQDTVRIQLMDLAARYGTDRLVIHTFIHDAAARLRSYELIADALL